MLFHGSGGQTLDRMVYPAELSRVLNVPLYRNERGYTFARLSRLRILKAAFKSLYSRSS